MHSGGPRGGKALQLDARCVCVFESEGLLLLLLVRALWLLRLVLCAAENSLPLACIPCSGLSKAPLVSSTMERSWVS